MAEESRTRTIECFSSTLPEKDTRYPPLVLVEGDECTGSLTGPTQAFGDPTAIQAAGIVWEGGTNA